MTQSSAGLKGSIWASSRPQNSTYRNYNYTHNTVTQSSSSSFTNPPTNLAPAAPTQSSTRNPLGPAEALQRLQQTCLRLRWKSLALEASLARITPEVAEAHGFAVDVAERNFKLDFYEFYSWIEQALVMLQRIFGIEITANGSGVNHAYHHNVLEALDNVENPLHPIFGKGDVREALWKAKELRNRWKDALGEKDTPSLGIYNLNWILGRILAGLEEAYILSSQKVASMSNGSGADMQEAQAENWAWMVEDSMEVD